jgi:hypothetical protein
MLCFAPLFPLVCCCCLCHNLTMSAVVDTRTTVGGFCWAKAEAVSHDSKRIFGAALAKTWLKGKVVSVSRRLGNDQAKRQTTFVTAEYLIGEKVYTKEIPQQSLKASLPDGCVAGPTVAAPVVDDADATVDAPAPATTVTANPSSPTSTVGMGSAAAAVQVSAQRGATDSTDESSQATATTMSTSTTRTPVAVAHDFQWFDGALDVPVNGPIEERRFWKVQDQYSGEFYKPLCDKVTNKLTPFDCFMAMFPKKQLEEMVNATSLELEIYNKGPTSTGEMLKFFGVLILATRFEFGTRASLWNTTSSSKYIPAPCFGKTGMSKNRFDDLWKCLVWSKQPKERPEDMSHEAWRWMLVEGFVKNFNNHRKKFVIPSWMICVDESICRWYGLGGHWINMGLPMYISFDRKPEDGCEVQNSCCGISNIMLQLKLVKSEREESRLASQRYVCCCLLFAVCASTMGWDLPINVLLYFGACQPR